MMNANKLSTAKAGMLCALALMTTPVVAQSSAWTEQVHSLIRSNFSYPRSAMVRGEEGQAIVRVAMNADGSITGVTLTKSSGSQILDREAIRIAEKMKRLPMPPKGTKTVSLPISWKLN